MYLILFVKKLLQRKQAVGELLQLVRLRQEVWKRQVCPGKLNRLLVIQIFLFTLVFNFIVLMH